MRRWKSAQRGSAIVEFSFVAVLLMLVVFAGIEFDRMVLVYTAVAHSARAGVRYAIVHGSDRTGAGDAASGPLDQSAVIAKVQQFATGFLNTAVLNVVVQYPGNNKPGSVVKVTVTYPYDPIVALPLKVNITSSTQGIIVF